MPDDRAFRVLVGFDPRKESFVARVPELDIRSMGATRSEAISAAEQAMEQRIAESTLAKETLPEPIDVREVSGTLTIKVAEILHRELLLHARSSGMPLEDFASQLLARAVGALEGARGSRRRDEPRPEEARDEAGGSSVEGPRTAPREDRSGGRSGRGSRRREGYHADLDDKANFLEYLRGLEKGGGGQGGGRGRR